MSSAASSGSSSSLVSASSLLERLEEQTVALGSLSDAHSTVAITLHLATLAAKPGAKCIVLSDQEPAAEKALPSIPPNWSSNADGFCFLYSLPSATGSSSSSASAVPQRLLVKSIKMDRTLLVHAALKSTSSNDASSVCSLEINVDDFVNSTELPGGAASKPVDFSKIFKDLAALLALYERNVLAKIFPSSSSSSAASTDKSQSSIASEGNRLPPENRPPQPFQPPLRPDDDHPEGFDPLRVYPRNPRMPGMGGPFAGDIDPLSGMPGGNLMGPGQFPFRGPGGGLGGPRVPGVPGMQPRFDPYGPMRGMGDPNFDEMLPPGPGGPLADIGGPLRRGPGGMGGGGFGSSGPRGFGGGGFGGGNNQFM